jgi:Flp pilus assembly protein TadG
MLPPFIEHHRGHAKPRSKEHGFTMALVAVGLVTIIAMAALAIDLGTLYQAKGEAQRAADAAALTAARMISISGITGDPTNVSNSWQPICGGAASAATLAAIKVAQQNLIGGAAATSANVSVKYGAGSAGASAANCTAAGAGFGVNPVVSVTVTSAKLPIFFARVFSLFPGGNYANTTTSATATAEVFNSSNSETVDASATLTPVQPRCVKPLIIPNVDPTNGVTPFINLASGAISNSGVYPNGVIGETFILTADCRRGRPNCYGGNLINQTPPSGGGTIDYVPALVQGTPVAVPSCATADNFQEAVGGCDQTTLYTCGTPAGAGSTQVDLTENPINPGSEAGDTGTAVQCLINAAGEGLGNGQDQLNTGTFPFQIQAGTSNPLAQNGLVANNGIITASNSIVTLPIFDSTVPLPAGVQQPNVTIVGFLQVFIQELNGNGHPVVYVLNVAGCGNGQITTVSPNPIFGTSPVPIRLITPP